MLDEVSAQSSPAARIQQGPLVVTGLIESDCQFLVSPQALQFILRLHDKFEHRRQSLLHERSFRATEIKQGKMPGFLNETEGIRKSQWQVAQTPHDLLDRRVEITGPAEAKMMINALNSGAKAFMVDLEDALSPTWSNVLLGQKALYEAVRRSLTHISPDGRTYQLREKLATLMVRPRGWHMTEKHVIVNGAPISASIWDFGLFFFHNAIELLARGSGPYFYLPKLENHIEAALWNDVFVEAQEALDVPKGSIRATVLIETMLAAFEMDEILFVLRDHAAGLNAGRWDYLFSMIKKFAHREDVVFPDRAQLTMTLPFMRAYTDLLVQTCHRRGAHAIGGMAAFIPSRKDPKVNEIALSKVREDKLRESGDGFDGTWVAHPDLVPVAMEIFNQRLGDLPHQKHILREGLQIPAQALLPKPIEGGRVTRQGVINNIDVALQYLQAWLQGQGAVAIHNLMEDAATAEISRAELWQWVRLAVKLEDGVAFTQAEFLTCLEKQMAELAPYFVAESLQSARELY